MPTRADGAVNCAALRELLESGGIVDPWEERIFPEFWVGDDERAWLAIDMASDLAEHRRLIAALEERIKPPAKFHRRIMTRLTAYRDEILREMLEESDSGFESPRQEEP